MVSPVPQREKWGQVLKYDASTGLDIQILKLKEQQRVADPAMPLNLQNYRFKSMQFLILDRLF